ncbi:MAG: hypothetical protein CL843_09385 [Crocinitomicaceae bacterium]|nr:hypothetical protein [Crocinitomicaceae bacterium]|tara:strand:+ start:3666 stop:3893 length:228 start_codon:yes stop_codon:yes gene_type:complete
MGLNGQQVIRGLKRDSDNYVKHYLGNICLHNNEGDNLGQISYRVFDNLLKKGEIKRVALSKEFWSDGYYQLSVGK